MRAEFEALKKLLAEAESDVSKAEVGQLAAGTRLRAAMRKIQNQAQEIRMETIRIRKETHPK